MRGDWEYVFGPQVVSKLPRSTLRNFSGYHPSEESHRRAFAKRIGITPAGINHIDDICGRNETCLDLLEGDIDNEIGESTNDPAEEYEPTPDPEPRSKKWDVTKIDKYLMQHIGDESQYIDRARIYFRWTQISRPLMMPSFLTKNIGVYKNLNIILGHVIFSFLLITLSDFGIAWNVGAGSTVLWN